MAMDIIPKSLYPLVPQAPGVPALLRNAASIADTATLGVFGLSDALDSLIGAEPVKWGIYNLSGQIIAQYDSFLSFDYSNGAKTSSYPIEKGSFAAYNKVDTPFDARIAISCGGDETRRSDFIKALNDAADSIDLFNILTPETSYFNVNIERFDYRRQANGGAGIIIAELYLLEVREKAAAAFSQPKDAGSSDAQAKGQLQPATPTVSDTVLAGPVGFA